jgi:hypothetical protein
MLHETLPDWALAELFKNIPLIPNESSDTKENAFIQPKNKDSKNSPNSIQANAHTFMFSGKNLKHIAVLIYETEYSDLPPHLLQLLQDILLACKLNINDIALINLAFQPLSFSEIEKQLQPQYCIYFGNIPKNAFPFEVPFYDIKKFHSCTFFQASSLNNMYENSREAKLEKSKLWICLKQIFM